MLPKEGEWTKVQLGKNTATVNDDHLTSFYVAVFPSETMKGDQWKPFGCYGQVVDVYVGRKRDYQRQFFAFVRFMGVGDEKSLEAKLQGIKC